MMIQIGVGLTYHFDGNAHVLNVQSKGTLFAGCPVEITVWYTKTTD